MSIPFDGSKIAPPKARFTGFIILFSLLLTACSSTSSLSPTPATQPSGPAQTGSHPPVILRVVEREDVVDGFLFHYEDIYFSDPDGDAAAVTYQLISSTQATPPHFSDDPIESTPAEQKAEALFTVGGMCWMKMELVFESRIRDLAGNLSEPVPFHLSCQAPQPVDTRQFLRSGFTIAIPIALILGFGFWLMFRKNPAGRIPALRSTLLMACLFMLLRFMQLILHEGGHSLYLLVNGIPAMVYAHPFTFSGYSRPILDNSIWTNVLGSLTAIPISLLISLLFWKQRSLALLPLVMLFPYAATMHEGINLMGITGDFLNLTLSTGMPRLLFFIPGVVIVLAGMISLFALLPLAGLDPRDNKILFVLPAALFIRSALSLLAAHLFVVGSPIDLEYFLGREIISGNSFLFHTLFGAALAILYVTLYRRIYPRLPAWLRTDTVSLTWGNLIIPGLLAAGSVILGVIIIT